MRLRATQDLLAVLLFLAVAVWCAASYVPITNLIMAGQPPGWYPASWISPLFVIDAVVAGLSIVAYAVVSSKLPAS